jgi:hypothetical protein
MSWLELSGSVTAVLVLAVLAWALKLGQSKIVDAPTACRLAEEMLAGFVARRAIVSQDGSAALVAGNGTIAVLKRHGARVAARRLIPPLRIREAVEGVTIDTGERMFGPVTLLGVLADEVERLDAPLTLV